MQRWNELNKKIKIALGYIFLFVLLSVGTIFINVCNFHTNILGHIDIPNHFFGGVVVAISLFIFFLPKFYSRKYKIIFTILYLSLIGFGWERIEIMVFEAGLSPGTLFEETSLNKVSDLAFGLAGFLASSRLVLNTKMRNIYRAGNRKFF